MKTMKKRLFGTMLLLASFVLLAACSMGTETDTNKENNQAAAAR